MYLKSNFLSRDRNLRCTSSRKDKGSGWSEKTLRHCLRAAETFSEDEIRYAARTQLTWTHIRSLMGIKDSLERQFYAQMCSMEHGFSQHPSLSICRPLKCVTVMKVAVFTIFLSFFGFCCKGTI